MSRVEHIGDAVLYLGDCREILPTLGKVDAVVTDPPYGIGFKYETHTDSEEEYPAFIWPIIEAAEALLSEGKPVFVWQSQAWMNRFHELFPRPWRILISARNFTQMNRHAMAHAYEPVVVWWTPGKPFVSAVGEGVGTPRDWHVADSAGGFLRNKLSGASEHPCPRQEDALEFVVGNWVPRGEVVLDPFMGSGTTGVACAKLGRKFIGIEIEPKYFDIACRRIEAAYKQPDLFIEKPKPATQEALL
jgi:site-specific DNA-methyltransferase (adenine-specific)